jgi:hypothetical protein
MPGTAFCIFCVCFSFVACMCVVLPAAVPFLNAYHRCQRCQCNQRLVHSSGVLLGRRCWFGQLHDRTHQLREEAFLDFLFVNPCCLNLIFKRCFVLSHADARFTEELLFAAYHRLDIALARMPAHMPVTVGDACASPTHMFCRGCGCWRRTCGQDQSPDQSAPPFLRLPQSLLQMPSVRTRGRPSRKRAMLS